VSVPATISLLPPVKPRSGVHAYRQNRCRRFLSSCKKFGSKKDTSSQRLLFNSRSLNPSLVLSHKQGLLSTNSVRVVLKLARHFLYPITLLYYTTHETPITKMNKRASTYLLQRLYKITSDHIEDECTPALRTNPAYLSRGLPASRRHVGGRPENFVVSATCTAWP
jgi:hypothetical protein